jgi:DNA-directed RNA polymerase specialized sigma24 family protein
MSILQEICKGHSKWVRMAQKFDYDNAEDLVQEMYLKIYNLNPKEVNEVYIYRTIKSIFVDDYKKKKLTAFPLRGGDIPDIADEDEIEDELKLSEIPLTCTELLVLKKLYGYTTENADTLQITVHKGKSLLSISKEVKLSYMVLYRALRTAKKKIYEYRIRRHSEKDNGVL